MKENELIHETFLHSPEVFFDLPKKELLLKRKHIG